MKSPPPVSPNLIARSPVCRTEAPAGYQWAPPPFRFALAFCDRDADRCLDLLKWIAELGPVDRELVIFYDKGTPDSVLKPIQDAANAAFEQTDGVVLAKSHVGWPGCNNFVWYHICNHMAAGNRPWLLLETDLAPCKSNWVSALEDEYRRARKPFMGSWVEYYDILNGAAVYPPDVRPWCPEFFKSNPTLALAYDCYIAPSIIWFSHNATHLMPHIWFTRANGRPGGMTPQIPEWSAEMVDWVCNHNAALVHRCKDDKLIGFLRARRQRSLDVASQASYSSELTPVGNGMMRDANGWVWQNIPSRAHTKP